jgi:hypothetical protein
VKPQLLLTQLDPPQRHQPLLLLLLLLLLLSEACAGECACGCGLSVPPALPVLVVLMLHGSPILTA